MTKHLAAKVMLDAGRLEDTSADTKLRVFVKHAWLEASNGKAIKARFGVVDTGYTGYEEAFIGLRYMAKSMADDQKVLSTADIGINAQGEQAGGMVSWHAAILNGEGYSKPELDAGKTGQARLSVDPLAKKQKFALPITGFVSYAIPAKGNDSVLAYAAAVGVKVPHVIGWVEYVGKSTAGVSSGGLTHDFLEKTAVSLTYERTQTEAGDATHGIFARLQAGF